jgi:hypothetical protein
MEQAASFWEAMATLANFERRQGRQKQFQSLYDIQQE